MRLKTRLALADFKRKHGFEKYDLSTLESSLFRMHRRIQRRKQHQKQQQQRPHRYYPTLPVSDKDLIRKPVCTQNYTFQSAMFLRSPLSAKRCAPPRIPSSSPSLSTVSSDEEDAANLLVMLHNMS